MVFKLLNFIFFFGGGGGGGAQTNEYFCGYDEIVDKSRLFGVILGAFEDLARRDVYIQGAGGHW